MSLISQMFALQQILNDNTNGDIWITGKTQENRKIDWHRCIYMEVVEAIDSFNWKHWKNINAPDDIENAKVEIVDIWHFVMSQAIIESKQNYADKHLNITTKAYDKNSLIDDLEQIINQSSGDKNIEKIIDLFFSALGNFMDIQELYARYVVKNKLNSFRQDNGYKDGNYKKIWNLKGKKVEDNVVAFTIMGDNPNITPDKLYNLLEKSYNS